jgi:hypothetical protein
MLKSHDKSRRRRREDLDEDDDLDLVEGALVRHYIGAHYLGGHAHSCEFLYTEKKGPPRLLARLAQDAILSVRVRKGKDSPYSLDGGRLEKIIPNQPPYQEQFRENLALLKRLKRHGLGHPAISPYQQAQGLLDCLFDGIKI